MTKPSEIESVAKKCVKWNWKPAAPSLLAPCHPGTTNQKTHFAHTPDQVASICAGRHEKQFSVIFVCPPLVFVL